MIVNKKIIGTLCIERTPELKEIEEQFIKESRYIRKHKRRKWLRLIFNTLLVFYLSSLFFDITANTKILIFVAILSSLFSFVMQEHADIRFYEKTRKLSLNIDAETLESKSAEVFKDKVSKIIDDELKKERISTFRANLNTVKSTPDAYEIEIEYIQ